ncbi:universal stress protein [Hamadaea sp. NPDC050747]|uniref:universal stress protein n=1 Tax=Hamadaea sp. NPDC050747 TaxID=3155789 RepID=UPI0033E9B1E1
MGRRLGSSHWIRPRRRHRMAGAVKHGIGCGSPAGRRFEVAAREVSDQAVATAAVRSTAHVVERGDPATVLLDHAKGDDLLVVGNRGHGEPSEALRGSVSHGCLHYGTCPVVVVRARSHSANPPPLPTPGQFEPRRVERDMLEPSTGSKEEPPPAYA